MMQMMQETKMKSKLLGRLAWFLLAASLIGPAGATTFTVGDADFLLDGKPFLVRCGEMHFARIPPEYWQHRLRMARAMGLNTYSRRENRGVKSVLARIDRAANDF
jgi:hypothetical protein